MKYRIKITNFRDNKKEYTAQVRILFFWFGINWSGSVDFNNYSDDNKFCALNRIERHKNKQRPKVLNTEFKYIDK